MGPLADKNVLVSLLFVVCFVRDGVPSTHSPSQSDNIDVLPAVTWPDGDPRWCLERLWRRENPEDRTQMFQVLPGLGWDNLRNMETAPVISFRYHACRLTDDGEFLIPDSVFIIPLKSSKLQTYAELIDEWKNLKSVTARTINLNPGFSMAAFSISGAFSREYTQVKGTQIEDKSATIRIQLRYHRYKAKLRPGPTLSSEFKSALLGIATHLELNQSDRARYESEVLVRNFGTHVLTSVTAGAGLVKEDYVRRSYIEDHRDDMAGMLHSASGAFKEAFSLKQEISNSRKHQATDDEGYQTNLTHSSTETLGGAVFLAGAMTAGDWAKDLDANLVAMDRAGDPLYLLITQQTLPELPQAMVERLEEMVKESVLLYYKMNTIPGCTDRAFSKFSASANLDDGSCKTKAQTGLALGGIYQLCEPRGETLARSPCDGVDRRNAMTGDLSCPDGFKAVLLHEGDGPGKVEYKRNCKWCNLVSKCCDTEHIIGYAHFKTYWCAGRADKLNHETGRGDNPAKSYQTGEAKAQQTAQSSSSESHKTLATAPDDIFESIRAEGKLGYNFGGVYTRNTENLVTNARTCPDGFYPRSIFFDLKVCISDDYETASPLAVPFGGFFSCSMGNPLASLDRELARGKGSSKPLESFLAKVQSSPGNWPKKCPTGYSQHLAMEVSGCAIHYCVESGALKGTELPKVRSPPFSPEPPESDEGPEMVFDQSSMTWIENPDLSSNDHDPDQLIPEETHTENRVVHTSGQMSGLASGSVNGQEPGLKTLRATGYDQNGQAGYIEMRTAVLTGSIAGCLCLVALTVAVAIYLVRSKGKKEEMIHTEVTPLRTLGNCNPVFEQAGDVAVAEDSRNMCNYTITST